MVTHTFLLINISQVPGRRDIGEGVMFREINRSRVSCAECGVTVAVSSLKGHMERQHVSSLPQTREVKIGLG